MAKYIDSGAFQAALVRKQCGPTNQRYTDGWNDCLLRVKSMVSKAPAADVAPVVRCKDCKHLCVWNRKDIYAFCPKTNIVFLPFDKDTRTFFCSYGERKEDA
nr:MAG TPA: Protein transport protein SEC23, Small coat, vesicular transport, Cytoplasmic [Caudoviricetes sp.]